MTLCNLTIEGGARAGLIAPDETTFAYLVGRPAAPKGGGWAMALDHWKRLSSDADAHFDREERIDVAALKPTVTWGTSPEDVVAVDGRVPDPATSTGEKAEQVRRALDYMGLEPGQTIADAKIDRVFIGSCTNSRIEDLRAAAAVARGRKVAAGVAAMVVPGSGLVKEQAEAEGLDAIFRAAGFDWREPGLLHVPGDEPGQADARRALRLDLQPQLRGPPGPRRPHPPDEPGHGGRGGYRRPHRRCAGVARA